MSATAPTREQLLHHLYEAAELEHNLMCTYLYAAFSLKRGAEEGLAPAQAEATEAWRRTLIAVAVEEMGHLTAVSNITSALGGFPRLGRGNFPLDPGYLPARVVVKLAPFDPATLQHFIYLERPQGSAEPEGTGFEPERLFVRGAVGPTLTPMALDYDTVGDFYAALGERLRAFDAVHGGSVAFCGDPALQLSGAELQLDGAAPVICLKSALAALDLIVRQGEGAPSDSAGSHYQRFIAIRESMQRLQAADPGFAPAHPAATNPVLRRPPRPQGRVWIEEPQAVATVDLANASYGLMLRLLAHAWSVPRPAADKALAVDLALGLMRAMVPLAEHAARLPAGPSNPGCHAGMSFTALRDVAALPAGIAAQRFVRERLGELSAGATALAQRWPGERPEQAARAFERLVTLAARFESAGLVASAGSAPAKAAPATTPMAPSAGTQTFESPGVESAESDALTLLFEAKRCIHARHCVTGAPTVFLANTPGAWLHPETLDAAQVIEIAHACPSGAIRYRRKDGGAEEVPPPVNLASVREAGPYGLRGDLHLSGAPIGYRATLCRCGASKNKPYCDGSHHDIGFNASGEPPTGLGGRPTEMLPERAGPLHIEPEPDGPLALRGNLEVLAGTGRMVCRITSARLCRCGGSASKPFCDGTHATIGFKAPA